MMMPNLYQRGDIWWGRAVVAGREHRRSLRTTVRHIAEARVTEWLHGLGSTRHQLVSVDGQPTPVIDNGTVYAMGYADRVKVGWTGRTSGWRLRQMQPFYPETLIIFGSCPGTRGDEARFHALFEPHRIRGEWFLCEGKVASWIEAGCPMQFEAAAQAR